MRTHGAVLLDTNVLIYAYEPGREKKRDSAKAVVLSLSRERRGVLSVQNLTEFCSVSLGMKPPVPMPQLVATVRDLIQWFRVIGPGAETVRDALDGVARHGLSFWDAMIWAVARANGVVEILSEDFQDGREVDGVLFTNPFAAA